MTELSSRLKQALEQLKPSQLIIEDDSALHAGHKGNNGGSHFTITIVSTVFNQLSPLKRHRLVYDAAKELMAQEIHALSINAKTPDEYDRNVS